MSNQLILNVFISPTGHHFSSWRHRLSEPERITDITYYAEIARTAERGLLHSLFLSDALSGGNNKAMESGGGLEPLTFLSALSMVTKHIGLIGTASSTFTDPFNIARMFASLDHISNGRAGWNIVTTSNVDAAVNFSKDRISHADRYVRAQEFLDVVTALWDSWEDDAQVLNKEAGIRVDGTKIHRIDHVGEEFQVQGPMNIPRPPQGWPVLVQAGSSEDGMGFASRWGEAIFTAHQTLEDAQVFYTGLKRRVAAAGRNPAAVKVLPGICAVIGSTEEEAFRKRDELDYIAVPETGPVSVSGANGIDLSAFPLDEPLPVHLLPDEAQIEGARSRFALIVGMAQREHLTVRQILRRLAGARGHFTIAGTPDQVADVIEVWFRNGAADGFNLMPPLFPNQFDLFIDEVVPILQRRGLFHTEYEGATLRENYGLDRPVSRYAAPGKAPLPEGSKQEPATQPA